MKKNKKGLVIGILFLLSLAFTSCGDMNHAEKKVPILLDDRKIDFMTEVAIKKDIEEKFEVEGRIYSSNIQELSFNKTGKLSQYDIYLGKEVKKGEILAAIDVSELEHNIKITKLKVEQDGIRLELAKKTGNEDKIKEAEIALKISNMELEKMNEHFNNSTLVSEVDGIVSSFIQKDIGTTVNPNITMIKVMDSNDLGVEFNLDEAQLEQVKVGDEVEIIIDDKAYKTEIINIKHSQLMAKIPEELNDQLKITSKIKVKKVMKTIENAILVPKIAIYTDSAMNSKVQVLEGEKIITKNVELGVEVNDYFQILEGVKEGDQLIVK